MLSNMELSSWACMKGEFSCFFCRMFLSIFVLQPTPKLQRDSRYAAAHSSAADSGVGEPPFPMQASKLPQTPGDNDVGPYEEVLGLARDTLLRVGEVGT